MKKTISEITISISILIVGICLLLWAEEVTNLVSMLLGALFIISGIFNGMGYIKYEENKQVNIISACIKIVIGIILLAKPNLLSEIISFIVGLFMLFTSIANLIKALEDKKAHNFNVTLGLSIAGIIIGLLCILGKFIIPNIILQFIGLMLIIYSIVNIIDNILLGNTKKLNEKQVITIEQKD